MNSLFYLICDELEKMQKTTNKKKITALMKMKGSLDIIGHANAYF